MPISDERIIEEIKIGDPRGCKNLFDKYANGLLSYAITRWKIPYETAEEIVSDVILKVFNCIFEGKFNLQYENSLRNYILVVLKNGIMDYFKNCEKNKEIPVNNIGNYENCETIPDEEVSKQLKYLLECLNLLQDWERMLLLCRAIGMKYSEVEQYTGKNKKVLKVIYKSKLKKLENCVRSKLSNET